MDILQRISRKDFLRTVGLKSGTYDLRLYNGENAYAFGCDINAVRGEFLVHDILTFLGVSILSSRGIPLRDGVRIIGPNWPLLEALAEHVETGHGIETVLPYERQTYFAVAPALDSSENAVLGGTWAAVMTALTAVSERSGGRYDAPIGFSVEALLRLAHTNARLAGVEIRPRFVVPVWHSGREAYLEEVAAYQAAAAARFRRMKGPAQRSKRLAKRGKAKPRPEAEAVA